MDNAEDLFYVYMYIDPRNLRPFYYGKGKGSRQFSHLLDTAESDKTAKIREIRREGLEPTIRVVAKGLSEDQALLVEKTLIWTSSELANIATGSFSRNFRPPNTLHRKLPNFDYPNQVHYFNVATASTAGGKTMSPMDI
jgi:hypothetical protein